MAQISRADLYKEIARKFVDSWNDGANTDKVKFVAQFSPTVKWHDHALRMTFEGSDLAPAFRAGWLRSVKDFKCEVQSIKFVEDGVAIQCTYEGTMVGKLWKPATPGEPFVKHVLLLLGINGDNKIQTVDEYYTSSSDAGGSIQTYKPIPSAKL